MSNSISVPSSVFWNRNRSSGSNNRLLDIEGLVLSVDGRWRCSGQGRGLFYVSRVFSCTQSEKYSPTSNIAIVTDSDASSQACFVVEEAGSVFVLTHHAKSRVLRIWDCSDGSLFHESKIAKDFPLTCFVPASLAVPWSALAQTNNNEVLLFDVIRCQKRAEFTGYSKQNPVRFVGIFCKSTVALIDCFGQLFLYDVCAPHASNLITHRFCEKKFSESFSVSISSGTMVLVCPLKLVVYRRTSSTTYEPYRTILSPDTSIVWRGVSIFSPRCIIANSSQPGIVWDVTEEDIFQVSVKSSIPEHYPTISEFISARIFRDQSSYFELFRKSSSEFLILPCHDFRDFHERSRNSRTFASDGPHVFLVEYSAAEIVCHPLSIPDCFIELVLPKSAGVTCVSGTVLNRRLVVGTHSGTVLVYIVGTSRMETEFATDMLGFVGIVGIVPIEDHNLFAVIDALGGVHVLEYNYDSGELGRKLKMKINFLINFLMFEEYQYGLEIRVNGDSVIASVVDRLSSSQFVYGEEWSMVTKRILRTFDGSGSVGQPSTTCLLLDDCCEVESSGGDLLSRPAAVLSFPKLSMKEKDVISNLWLGTERFWSEVDFGLSVKSKYTQSFQTGVSYIGSQIWKKIIGKFFNPQIVTEDTPALPVEYFGFFLKLIEFVIGDGGGLIVDDVDEDTVRLVKLCEQELARMIASGSESVRLEIERAVFEEKNLLVYCLVLGIAPKYLSGFSEAVGVVFDTIATDEEARRKSSLISSLTASVSRRQSVNVVSGDEKVLFHIEMAEKVLRLFAENELITMNKLAVLLTLGDSYANLRKLIVNKDVLNSFFFTVYGWIVVGSGREVVPMEDEIGSRENSGENLSSFGAKFLSRNATDIVVSIGFNNSMKFAKRLAALIKAKHSSVVPLFLVRRLIEKYSRHSIRILPMLMELVILPCLDSLDYRLRKTSIQPTSEVFKSMNRRFPMTAFHQNRQKFAIGSTQGQVFVYDIRSATKWRILDGHTGAISAVGFDPSGKHLCSYSATDCTVRVWYLASGGVASAGPVVVSGSSGAGSVLSGLLGTNGGKCVQVKQLGATDQDDRSGIKHPFTLIHRIQSVKIRWTSESDILLVRENGEGAQIKL